MPKRWRAKWNVGGGKSAAHSFGTRWWQTRTALEHCRGRRFRLARTRAREFELKLPLAMLVPRRCEHFDTIAMWCVGTVAQGHKNERVVGYLEPRAEPDTADAAMAIGMLDGEEEEGHRSLLLLDEVYIRSKVAGKAGAEAEAAEALGAAREPERKSQRYASGGIAAARGAGRTR